MDDLIVSIIVPVYKAEQILDECLNSVIGPDYPALEIILEDDGSLHMLAARCEARDAARGISEVVRYEEALVRS